MDMSQAAEGNYAKANAKIDHLTGTFESEVQTQIGGVTTPD